MPWFYHFIIILARGTLRIFYRLRVYGKEHYYDKRAIIAPNHASYLDPPMVAVSWPHEIHFLASDYLFRVPLFGALIRKLNSHPINREKADLASIKMICQLLNEDKQVLIFPEGTRTADGNLAPLKSGVAMIALRSKAAVVPAYVHGSYKAWNRNHWFPRPWGRAAVVFGSPILYEELAHLEGKQQQKVLLERLEQAIRNLQTWFETGAKGSPP